jgi:hypothetical protein
MRGTRASLLGAQNHMITLEKLNIEEQNENRLHALPGCATTATTHVAFILVLLWHM